MPAVQRAHSRAHRRRAARPALVVHAAHLRSGRFVQVPLAGADPVAAAAVASHARPLLDAILRGDAEGFTEGLGPSLAWTAAGGARREAGGGGIALGMEGLGWAGGLLSGRALWRALETAREAVEARLAANGMWRTTVRFCS